MPQSVLLFGVMGMATVGKRHGNFFHTQREFKNKHLEGGEGHLGFKGFKGKVTEKKSTAFSSSLKVKQTHKQKETMI